MVTASWDQIIVGTLAVAMGLMAGIAAAGSWRKPYQLRTLRTVRKRWGKSAARALLFLVAAAMLAAGVGILCGARPSYAIPDSGDRDRLPRLP